MGKSAISHMMLTLYSLLTWALQPLVKLKLKRRARQEPLYAARMGERFGQYLTFATDASRPLVWLHAVSLGESRAAAILLKELRSQIPQMRLLLTSGTATGYAEGEKLLQEDDIHVWQPWDTSSATQQFFTHFKPSIGILIETEVWPNLIAAAKAVNIPVILANARMSEKTKSQSLRFQSLARQTYRDLSGIYAQTQSDAARLMQLGAIVNGVFGNLKFDVTPHPGQMLQARQFKASVAKPIVVFASSREGEEAELLAALKDLPTVDFERAQWLIVPRHPQRFDEVAHLIQSYGFQVTRRNEWASHSIWLGDTVGEMAFHYGISDVALLGGSFAKLGGQNLIEALACGCPVVMGPHTYNFQEAARLAALSHVAFKADGLAEAVSYGLALCANGRFDRTTASSFVASHQGAAVKTAQAIAVTLQAGY